ncbi:MAG TPA: DinB family protein [Chitinophagaceae bacterium]|nr:DinB family protein [Chitinophagaceae bacterium]
MKKQLLKDLAKARKYTLEVAEAMPEKSLGFKPAPETWAFNELMQHMAYSLIWMEENYLLKKETKWMPPEAGNNKKDLIAKLEESFDTVEKHADRYTLQDETLASSFYAMLEHNAHHRGQAVTYLRCCGVIPPEYPF